MGIDYSNNTVSSIDKNQRISSEQINEAFFKNNPAKSDKNQLTVDRKTSLFGVELESYLMELNAKSEKISGKIKLIIMFKDQTGKEVRLDYLESIFNNYKVIYNYDVIAGVYLEVDLYELLENYDLLKSDGLVVKMYKSKVFQTEINQNDFMAANPLNESKYENWWLSAMGADDLAYNGSGIRVAVVDSGVYDNHPDLNVAMQYDFVDDDTVGEDNNGHGTHVSGIVASSGASSGGKYMGVAPGVKLINAKAGNSTGSLEDGNILAAIEWAAKPVADDGAGADIISMSFGGGFPFAHEPLATAISNISKQYDVIMVASAGNSGPDYFTGSQPAAGVSIISVGATDKSNNLASFSSVGPSFTYTGYPDIVAPGVNIFSTLAQNSIIAKQELFVGDYVDYADNGDYMPLSGTSMSCPMVAGALAIILSANPDISVETARIALMEGASKLPNSDDDTVRSGIGLVNITASLNYLKSLSDKNDIAKVFPDSLPVKPNTLLNFGGDRQLFNLSVFSGSDGTFSLVKDSEPADISVSIDDSDLAFSEAGVGFGIIDITIQQDCSPGVKTFQIKLEKSGVEYDSIDISFEVKLPEHKVLMESYHGTTDWYPSLSYSQIGYYESMIDMAGLNLSVDYKMEYWTPGYNSTTDASILTEAKLAQYDLVVLETPFIPYSPLETRNLKNYYENGGNVLFLGTRYEDLCSTNINEVFSELGVGIQIKEETIAQVEENGLGASIFVQNVTLDEDHPIFDNVDQFLWGFGNSFEVSGNAESIAEINNKTVVAAYDGSAVGNGKIVAFGDHHWMHTYYTESNFESDHRQLLRNMMSYLLEEREVSLSIELDEFRTSDGTIDFSVYAKYQGNDSLVSREILNDNLNIRIGGTGITFSTSDDGIVSITHTIGSTSPDPVLIEAILKLGTTEYEANSSVLYYSSAAIPQIQDLSSSVTSITRETGQSLDITADMDKLNLPDFNAYLSLFTYSFFNKRRTRNDTISLSNTISSPYKYTGTFDPNSDDPAGFGVYYVIPETSGGYIDPNSPRRLFFIVDYAPRLVEDQSFFDYGEGDIAFDDTYSDEGSQIYQVTQGMDVNFSIEVRDREDDSSELDVFVILFMAQITRNNSLSIMLPRTIISERLPFQEGQDHHSGIFKVPSEMEFSSIEGPKNITTATDFTPNTGGDYLALYYINVIDQDGGTIDQPFAIILSIEPGFNISFLWIALLVIGGTVGVIIIITKTRKSNSGKSQQKRNEDVYFQPATKESSYYGKSREDSDSQSQSSGLSFCPNCGEKLKNAKRFCPNCGEKLPFK